MFDVGVPGWCEGLQIMESGEGGPEYHSEVYGNLEEGGASDQ